MPEEGPIKEDASTTANRVTTTETNVLITGTRSYGNTVFKLLRLL